MFRGTGVPDSLGGKSASCLDARASADRQRSPGPGQGYWPGSITARSRLSQMRNDERRNWWRVHDGDPRNSPKVGKRRRLRRCRVLLVDETSVTGVGRDIDGG